MIWETSLHRTTGSSSRQREKTHTDEEGYEPHPQSMTTGRIHTHEGGYAPLPQSVMTERIHMLEGGYAPLPQLPAHLTTHTPTAAWCRGHGRHPPWTDAPRPWWTRGEKLIPLMQGRTDFVFYFAVFIVFVPVVKGSANPWFVLFLPCSLILFFPCLHFLISHSLQPDPIIFPSLSRSSPFCLPFTVFVSLSLQVTLQ